MYYFEFSVPLDYSEVLFAPILSMLHLLHQIKHKVRETCTKWMQFIIQLYLANWIKGAGVDFGTWSALASFACRALIVGKNSLLQGAPGRPVSLLKLMHDRVFLTGCFKCSLELFDLVLQTLFTLLLFTAVTVEFITGYFIWVRAEHTRGFESMQCIYK